jgi:hypothetical protein
LSIRTVQLPWELLTPEGLSSVTFQFWLAAKVGALSAKRIATLRRESFTMVFSE